MRVLFNAIFGCLKLSNEMTVNLLRMPYDNVMNIVATSKKFWDYLVNGTEVEQINWSFFEES